MFPSKLGFRSNAIVPTGVFGNNSFWGATYNIARELEVVAGGQTQTNWDNLKTYYNTNGYTIEYWIYPTNFGPDPLTATILAINPGPGSHNSNNTNYWS